MIKTFYNKNMTIYIEEFLLQNILINISLLKLIELTSKCRTTKIKMLCASIVGAAFSVICAMFINNNIWMNVLKVMCSFLMIKLAFIQTKKEFVANYILMYIYTFVLYGFVKLFATTSYTTNFGVITKSKVNLHIISIIIFISCYIIQLVANNIKFKFKSNKFIYKIKLYQNNNSITLNAFLDTGNMLNYNGNPVILLDLNSYLKLTKTNLISFYITKSEQINMSTVTGSNSLKLFKLDKVEINNANKKLLLTNQYVAINTNNTFKNTNFQALLNPMLF